MSRRKTIRILTALQHQGQSCDKRSIVRTNDNLIAACQRQPKRANRLNQKILIEF